MTSLRERFYHQNTLACLLVGLEGHVTTVELRHETSVRGRIENVNPINMNMQMSDATFVGTDGHENQFDTFFVKGCNIRFVQVPDRINMLRLIKHQLKVGGQSAAAAKPKRVLTKEQKKEKQQRVICERLGTEKST